MTSIGDIAVHRGDPPDGNPYKGRETTHVSGEERSRALGRFIVGKDPGPYTFWFAPVCGGARRLDTPPDDINPATIEYYWHSDGTPRARR